MMGDFGLIKLNYHFFHLYINGESHGLYALEEKLSKEIVERNQREEMGHFLPQLTLYTGSRDDLGALKDLQRQILEQTQKI